MDPLLWSLQNTFSPNAQDRDQAEKTLQQLEEHPVFVANLMNLIVNKDVDVALRQAAAITLKNFHRKLWSNSRRSHNRSEERDDVDSFLGPRKEPQPDPSPATKTPEDLRLEQVNAILKLENSPTNILNALLWLPIQNLRVQLGVIFQQIVEDEWPQSWPHLIPYLMGQLTSNDPNLIYGALFAFLIFASNFQFRHHENKQREFFEVIGQVFPTFLNLFRYVLTLNEPIAADMQILLIKIFWKATQRVLPPHIANEAVATEWLGIILEAFRKPPPFELLPSPPPDPREWNWWKVKKWAGHVFLRYLSRYGSETHAETDEDKKFSIFFKNQFLVNILQAEIQLLTLAKTTTYPIPPKVTCVCLNYITNGIRFSKVYKLLQPYMSSFLKDIIFPLLCFTPEDQQLWVENPYEYARQESDVMDFYNPRVTAVGLLLDLLVIRGKKGEHLFNYLAHINHVFQRYQHIQQLSPPEQQRLAIEKYGAIYSIGSMSGVIQKNQTLKGTVENMLVSHVFPDFTSPFPFLRAVACWTFKRFYDVKFTHEEVLNDALQKLLNCMKDPQFIVRVEAAKSLRALIRIPKLVEILRPNLGELLQVFFQLMNEIESEEIVSSLECILLTFDKEIIPYAAAIVEQMCNAFLKFSSDREDESTALPALECLNTLSTILGVTHENPALYVQYAHHVCPLLASILGDGGIDFLEEALQILSYMTFASPTPFSPQLWSLFDLVYQAFEGWAFDFISDMLAPFDQYLTRDAQTFVQDPSRAEKIFTMFQRTLDNKDGQVTELVDGCRLMEVVFIYTAGSWSLQTGAVTEGLKNAQITSLIPRVLSICTVRLQDQETKPILQSVIMQLVSSMLFYDADVTLRVLEENGLTAKFFGLWFKLLPTRFPRLYDKKLCAMGLCSVLRSSFLPAVIKHHLLLIVESLLSSFPKIDEAAEELKARAASPDDEDIESLEEDDDEQPDIDEEDDYTTDMNMLKELANQAAQARDDDDDDDDGEESEYEEDDIDEEPTLVSTIDIKAYFLFSLERLRVNDGQAYQLLTESNLAERIKEVYQGLTRV